MLLPKMAMRYLYLIKSFYTMKTDNPHNNLCDDVSPALFEISTRGEECHYIAR